MNLGRFIQTVHLSILTMAAHSLHPNLRDRILGNFFPKPPTAKLLTTQAAAAATKDQAEYPESPEKCRHESGVRQYGAAGLTISICDRCGSRWALNPELRQWAIARPKASPAARTPLGINFHKS